MKRLESKFNADAFIYLSHSEDPKKNPLSYKDKIKFGQKAFGKIIQESQARTFIQALGELTKKGYSHVYFVAGSDRINEYQTLVDKYNGGKDFSFEEIKIISAGERDPDSEDVSGMSASKLRSLAEKGDFEAFAKGTPFKNKSDAVKMYDAVRKGMRIAESVDKLFMSEERSEKLYYDVLDNMDHKHYRNVYGESSYIDVMINIANSRLKR